MSVFLLNNTILENLADVLFGETLHLVERVESADLIALEVIFAETTVPQFDLLLKFSFSILVAKSDVVRDHGVHLQ